MLRLREILDGLSAALGPAAGAGNGRAVKDGPGLFWGKNSSRHLNYRMTAVPPSALHFLAFPAAVLSGEQVPTPRSIALEKSGREI